MSNTKKMALTGLLCALGAVIMMMGGLVPLATFCCPLLAGVVLIPVFVECGSRMAYGAYVAIAALGLILCPDKEAALLFAFIGYYPVLRWRLEQIRLRGVRILIKLLVFNLSVIAMYTLAIFLLQMDQLAAEYREMGMIMTGFTLLLGNVCLLLYDRCIVVITYIYVNRFRDKLNK